MTTIDCISDLHGYQPTLPGGDLLIVAGDLTARDKPHEYDHFFKWLEYQKYKKIIYIAGNHDGLIEKNNIHLSTLHDIHYLFDSMTIFEGLKIWGSPWTPTFLNWHFMKNRGQEIKEKWDLIPDDIDILITHGPPYGVLDKAPLSSRADKFKHCGCEELRLALERIKPKLHVFGHIHGEGGKTMLFKHLGPNTICVNASIMDEDYNPVNQTVRVIL